MRLSWLAFRRERSVRRHTVACRGSELGGVAHSGAFLSDARAGWAHLDLYGLRLARDPPSARRATARADARGKTALRGTSDLPVRDRPRRHRIDGPRARTLCTQPLVVAARAPPQ